MTSTGVTHGADTDRLEEIAGQLLTSAQRVGAVADTGTASAPVLEEAWAGADCEDFIGSWQSARQMVEQAETHLRAFAAVLLEQAAQQDATSGSGSSSSPEGRSSTGRAASPDRSAGQSRGWAPLPDWVNAPLAVLRSEDPHLAPPDDGWRVPDVVDDATTRVNDWWRSTVYASEPGLFITYQLDKHAERVERMGPFLVGVPQLGPMMPLLSETAADELRSWSDIAADPKGYFVKEMSTPWGQAGMAASVLGGPLGRGGSRVAKEGFEEAADRLRLIDHEPPTKVIGGYDVPEDAVRVSSGQKGAWNKDLHRPEPDRTYVVDDTFVYVTDEHGRVREAHGVLTLDAADRNTYQQGIAGGPDRLPQDHGGHLFARVFGGPGEGINLVAMTKDANLS